MSEPAWKNPAWYMEMAEQDQAFLFAHGFHKYEFPTHREALDAFVFVGAGLIIAGVLWNLQSEAWRTVAPSTGSCILQNSSTA